MKDVKFLKPSAGRRGSHAILAILSLLALPFLFSACAVPAGSGSIAEKPFLTLTPAQQAGVDGFLGAVYKNGQNLNTYAARGKASLKNGSETLPYSFELIAEKPDKIIFTILDLVGSPMLKIASTGEEFTALNYLNSTAYTGSWDSWAFRSVFPLPLPKEDMIALFSASLPEPPAAARTKSLDQESDGGYVFFFESLSPKDPGRTYEARILAGPDLSLEEPPLLNSLLIKRAGSEEIAASYPGHLPYPRTDNTDVLELFPSAAVIVWDNGDKSLTLEYSEAAIGFEADEAYFAPDVPKGFKKSKI
jgi:outer membrane lipoprotein-sorting protein